MEVVIKSDFSTLISIVEILVNHVTGIEQRDNDAVRMLKDIRVGINNAMDRYSENSHEYMVMHGCLGYIQYKTGIGD